MGIEVLRSYSDDLDKAFDEIKQGLSSLNPKLLVVFFWYGYDFDKVVKHLEALNVPFIGGEASRILNPEGYIIDRPNISVMAFEDDVVDGVVVDKLEVNPMENMQKAYEEAKNKLSAAFEKLGMSPTQFDSSRVFVLDMFNGLWLARPHLDGQMDVAFDLRIIGGLAGGKEDFTRAYTVSSTGSGDLSTFALISLKPGHTFYITRHTTFDLFSDEILRVTAVDGPKIIKEFNGKPALQEYSRLTGVDIKDMNSSTFATYTLGIDPGDGELLISSILKITEDGGLFIANEVKEGFEYKLYKAKTQVPKRSEKLAEIKKHGELIGYISFDCVYCYISRDMLNEVDKVYEVYKDVLEKTPFIGYATYGEIVDGANVNQTETVLALLKK